MRTERWKYVRYLDHPDYEELYDLVRDPKEETNLAQDARFKDEIIELRKRCDALIEEAH